jgi:hypothetical protein
MAIHSIPLPTLALIVLAAAAAGAQDASDIQVGQWNHMLVVTAPAGDDDPGPAVRRLLDQRIAIDVHDEGVDQIADFLRSVSGLNVIVAPDVLAHPPTVSLTVKDMPLGSVLRWVETLGHVHVGWRDEACYISSGAEPGPMRTTYYDVSDLVMQVPDFPGPDLDIPQPGGHGAIVDWGPVQDKPQTSTEDVADLVRRMIAHQP